MPLESRFRRFGAAPRPFVNREPAFAAFDRELAAAGGGPRVLNVTGIGGIGKSRLLRELREHVRERHRTALLDLQTPSLREQESALATLRLQFGTQGIRFDRYDVAYAALWQRLHPHLRISRRTLPLVEESEILAEVVDDVAGLPVFGTFVGLVRLLDKAASGVQRWRLVREDPVLQRLDGLSNADLTDAVTYLFAEDLRAASGEQGYVVFIDAHEALAAGPRRRAGTGVDAWLRDLIVQLDRGVTVVASREAVRWDILHPDWAGIVSPAALDDLPMSARLQLLELGDVADPREREAIAQASMGVPLYLNLAIDTRQRFSEHDVAGAISPEEILERFLQHVDPDEVRVLELLSVARTFDYDVFGAVASAFDLPRNRVAWESLISYSFVYTAGSHRLQLHQLVANAMAHRLSSDVARDVHRVLREFWDGHVSGNSSSSDVALACREAAYHGLHAGDLLGHDLLGYADQVVARGGAQGLGGLHDDVERRLAADLDAPPDLRDAARCLEAEACLLVGDPRRAAELVPEPPRRPVTEVQARLAMTAANARRILGETRRALDVFNAVWESYDGRQRLVAGHWAADLHMAQGRFVSSARIAGEIMEICPADDAEMLGDTTRLMFMNHRFAFQFDGAARHLTEAERHYTRAATIVGLANIATNRAELLAWTSPQDGVMAADHAVQWQREIGAVHEVGKAYTAMALAHLLLDELPRAEAALELACEALDRAGYQSGRARAELVRAGIHARRGSRGPAGLAARRAVEGLEAAEVYPTLVLLADRFLELAGYRDDLVELAADRARAAIEPLDSPLALDTRISHHAARFLGR